MKKAAIIFLTLLFVGCDNTLYNPSSNGSNEKDNEEEFIEDNNGKEDNGMRLVTALRGRYYFENKNAEYEEFFEYDDQNRVIKWEIHYPTHGYTHLFYYYDNVCDIYMIYEAEGESEDGDSERICTFIFDNDKLTLAKTIFSESGTNDYYFTYNEKDQLTSTQASHWTDTYLWSNGNLLYAMDGEEIVESYEYYDIENKCNVEIYTLDWYRMPLGWIIDRTVYGNMMGKDLLKKMDDTEFKYEFDDDGYVTKVFYYEDDELQVELNVEYNY